MPLRGLLAATKAEIRQVIDTAEADELRRRPGTIVLDVREADEFEQGAIPGALFLPEATWRPASRARCPTSRRRSSSSAPAAAVRRSPPRP